MASEHTCYNCADVRQKTGSYCDGSTYTYRGCRHPGREGWAAWAHWPCRHAIGTAGEPVQLTMLVEASHG